MEDYNIAYGAVDNVIRNANDIVYYTYKSRRVQAKPSN